MQKRQKTNWEKILKVNISFYKKFLRFPSFVFCPTPKQWNWEILKSVPLLQLLTVIGTEDAKTTKNKLRKKVKGQATLAEEISEVSKFLILSYTQNQKLGNLENCSFTLNFDSNCNLWCRNHKKLNWDKNLNVNPLRTTSSLQ